MSEINDKVWMVIYTKPRSEKKLGILLQKMGIEANAFLYHTVRQWSDRKKKVELPLIPGFVFVHYSLSKVADLYEIPFVNGLLKINGEVAIVKAYEINNLRIISKEWSGEKIIQSTNLQFEKGEKVVVNSGNFMGMVGELVKIKGKHKLVVVIVSLNVSFTLEIAKSKVTKIKNPKETLC